MNSKINHSEKKVENSIVCYHFVWLYGLKGCMCVHACTNTYPHPHVHRTTLEVFAWKIITSGCHVEGTWGSRMKRRVIFYCRAFCTLWTFCFVHVITFSLKKNCSKTVFCLSEAMTDSIQQRNYVNQVPSSITYPHTHIALCIVLHGVCM